MIFFAILLTAFVYLIFPIIYVANNGKVNPKKGKKLALSNTIVCATIWFLITLIVVSSTENASAEIGGYSLAPAFFYYFIAKAIFTDKNLNDDDTTKNTIENNNEFPTENDANEDLLNYLNYKPQDEEETDENFEEKEGFSTTDNELNDNNKKETKNSDMFVYLWCVSTFLPPSQIAMQISNQVTNKSIKILEKIFIKNALKLKSDNITESDMNKLNNDCNDVLLKLYKKYISDYLLNNYPDITLDNIDKSWNKCADLIFKPMLKADAEENNASIKAKLQETKNYIDTLTDNELSKIKRLYL